MRAVLRKIPGVRRHFPSTFQRVRENTHIDSTLARRSRSTLPTIPPTPTNLFNLTATRFLTPITTFPFPRFAIRTTGPSRMKNERVYHATLEPARITPPPTRHRKSQITNRESRSSRESSGLISSEPSILRFCLSSLRLRQLVCCIIRRESLLDIPSANVHRAEVND